MQILDVVDDTTESKVLASSRVRGVLEGAQVVNIELPNDDDAVQMLLSYADLQLDEPPPEALEIVKYCNHLPLAIGIAGKFVKDLELGADADWGEVLAEMRVDTDTSGQRQSREEAIIATSLKGIKGASSEEVLSLFHSLALLAEDAQCALDVVPVLFHAETMLSGGGGDLCDAKPPSLIRIRKWLKVLIDRSLVLGPIDRPSLHDIVRDYVIGQHSQKQLQDGHRLLVEYFRTARPADSQGRPRWDPTLVKQDNITSYVCEHIQYHLDGGWQEDRENDKEAIEGWLADTPQDELVLCAGRVFTVPKLAALAEKNEGTDWWLAARLRSLEQALIIGTEGAEAAVPSLLKALDALQQVEPGDERDDLELALLYELFLALNFPELMARMDQAKAIVKTEAAKRDPIAGAMLSQVSLLPQLLAGDKPSIEAMYVSLFRALLVDGTQNPDPATRTRALLLGMNMTCFGFEYFTRISHHPNVSLWDFVGEECEKIIEAFEQYDFALHPFLAKKANVDALIFTPCCCSFLLMRTGRVVESFEWMERALGYQRRALAETTAETATLDTVGIAYLCSWPVACASLRLPREQQAIALAMMDGYSLTWENAAKSVDDMYEQRPTLFRQRGNTSKDPDYLLDVTWLEWLTKASKLSCPSVFNADVVCRCRLELSCASACC
eukprot:COSAG02_NODE_4130_length_5740_cov_3.273888_4_plen_669_part_00